jgi:hypothetical protein
MCQNKLLCYFVAAAFGIPRTTHYFFIADVITHSSQQYRRLWRHCQVVAGRNGLDQTSCAWSLAHLLASVETWFEHFCCTNRNDNNFMFKLHQKRLTRAMVSPINPAIMTYCAKRYTNSNSLHAEHPRKTVTVS